MTVIHRTHPKTPQKFPASVFAKIYSISLNVASIAKLVIAAALA